MRGATHHAMVICLAEDRRSCEPALRLLIASLDTECRGTPIQLFSPNPSDPFRRWLTAYPSVTLNEYGFASTQKYDVKPHALLNLLDRRFQEVVWIDSDVLVCSDCRRLFDGLNPEVLV